MCPGLLPESSQLKGQRVLHLYCSATAELGVWSAMPPHNVWNKHYQRTAEYLCLISNLLVVYLYWY